MILETDQALAGLLKAKAFGGAAIGVAFDQPGRAWIQTVTAPTVNLFLFDIRENAHRRDVMYEEVRDEHGVLVARRPPPRRFDLHYTITAWAPKALVEHKLLGIALRCFAAFDIMPRDLLPAPLAELPYEVLLTTGAGVKRGMFLNLAGDMKAGFELTVTVPLPPLTELLAPPVVQEPARIEVKPMPGADQERTVPAVETVQGQDPDAAAKAEGQATAEQAKTAEAKPAEAKPDEVMPEQAKLQAAAADVANTEAATTEAPKTEQAAPEQAKPEEAKTEAPKAAKTQPEKTKPESEKAKPEQAKQESPKTAPPPAQPTGDSTEPGSEAH